ncbi:tyrosine-protein phosphatase [Paenibacillus sp. LPE1-1-1.1]|uniref:tyrosine-protein phosphatase n=1 Tax=Paenibacillus sp. LPE1-1-1.1 TaxID=3135230 RepID=UPI00342001C2
MNLQQTEVIAQSIELKMVRMGENQIQISWHPPVKLEKVAIYRSAANEFNEAESHLIAIVTQGSQWTFQDPQPNARGYYYVKFSESMVISVTDRVLPLEGALNFRDMGGYVTEDGRRVKWGSLFRSADLSRLSPTDLPYLKELGIQWICDLRTAEEVALSPSPQIGIEQNENLSFMPTANPNLMSALAGITESMLVDMNRHMVGNTALTSAILQKLLEGGGAPALFHCAAGKDRTGFVSAVLLQAMGVPRSTVLHDYALTNLFTDRFKEQWNGANQAHAPFMSELTPAVAQALMEARPAYLQASFDEIDARYGSFEQYWEQALGFTQADREKLQSMYLTP